MPGQVGFRQPSAPPSFGGMGQGQGQGQGQGFAGNNPLMMLLQMLLGSLRGGQGMPGMGQTADPLTSPWSPYLSQGKPSPSPFQNQSTLSNELRHFAGSSGNPEQDPQTQSFNDAFNSNNFDPWGWNYLQMGNQNRNAYQQYLNSLPQRGIANPGGGLVPGSNRQRP